MKYHREWIEQIVLEVLQRMETACIPAQKEERSRLYIVFTQLRLPQEVDEVIHYFQKEWDVMHSLVDMEDRQDIFLPASLDKVLFMDVNQDLIIRGALGLTDTQASEALSTCIQRDIPVSFVLKHELNQLLTQKDMSKLSLGTRRYYENIIRHKERLEAYGVTFQEHVHISRQESITYRKKLLTERDIHSIHANVLLVQKQTIITPLAWDAAKDKGMELRRIQE